MRQLRLLFITFALFSISAGLHGQTAREIVEKYINTVSNGDIRNWDKIRSLYSEIESYYNHSNFDQTINLANNAKPSYIKVHKIYPDKTKTESYEDSTYLNLTSTFYYIKDQTIIQFANQPVVKKLSPTTDEFHSDFLPVRIWKLLNKSKSLKILGIKEFPTDKSRCYEIQMVTNQRNYMLYINTSTFLLDYWNGREDEDLTIMNGFKKYKSVDRFLIAMEEILTKNEIVFFYAKTKKIEINPKIDPKIFDYSRKK